jgi:RNA polymerase subunit RPABC4/transcription elongation factor Spt4
MLLRGLLELDDPSCMAQLVTCKTCTQSVSANAPACPHCGEPNAAERAAGKAWGGLIVLVLLVLFIVFGLTQFA